MTLLMTYMMLFQTRDKILIFAFLLLWISLQILELRRLEICKGQAREKELLASTRRFEINSSNLFFSSREPLNTWHSYFDCSVLTGIGEIICEVQYASMFYSPTFHPTVAVRDISFMRYFAQRDLQGWTFAFSNLSFELVEHQSKRSIPLDTFAVLLCLGINLQDTYCIKKENYVHLNQGQRVNQIYSLRNVLWKKDAFCYTMREALSGLQSSSTNFIFPCWVLPHDLASLDAIMAGKVADYIVKPSDRGEGHGIFVTRNFDDLLNDTFVQYVVQPLLPDPLLVKGRKVDLRTYVLVTSILPLRAYIFKEGLVRFASTRYEGKDNNSKNEQSFLTNTSIGKKYTDLSNLTWTFAKFKSYIDTMTNTNSRRVFQAVNEVIAKTLLSSELRFASEFASDLEGYNCRHCYQLLGVDVILDANFQPKVLEVNGLPSMQLSHELGVLPDPSSVYTATKYELMANMLQMIFKPTDVMGSLLNDLNALNIGLSPGPLCEPSSHNACIDRLDLRYLIHLKRELVNSGGFSIIYPQVDGDKFKHLINHIYRQIQQGPSAIRSIRTSYLYHNLSSAILKLHFLK